MLVPHGFEQITCADQVLRCATKLRDRRDPPFQDVPADLSAFRIAGKTAEELLIQVGHRWDDVTVPELEARVELRPSV